MNEERKRKRKRKEKRGEERREERGEEKREKEREMLPGTSECKLRTTVKPKVSSHSLRPSLGHT